MARLKVFQVIESGGPGGSGYQVAQICNGLDRERFEVGLVYAVRPGSSAEEFRALAKGASKAFYVPMVREIAFAADWAAYRELRRIFREEKPDVVHAHCSKAGVLARFAARSAGVPRIFYSPRGYSFLMQDRPTSSRAFYRLLERLASWIGDIVAVSPSEAALARKLAGERRVHVAPDPYWGDVLPARPPEEGRDLVIAACGRMTFARNPEAFVRLAQRLTDSRNGLRCLWIGDGELGELVREMIRDMNLSNRLEVTGWLPQAEARERLSRADILVHFSRWEGLPNAVLDAMAAGLPVVASDVPGNRDAVLDGETGLIATSEIDLLEKTLRLVDDPALRSALGTAGRRRVESEFSPRKLFSILERLYSGAGSLGA